MIRGAQIVRCVGVADDAHSGKLHAGVVSVVMPVSHGLWP